jgi:hypothetical protein
MPDMDATGSVFGVVARRSALQASHMTVHFRISEGTTWRPCFKAVAPAFASLRRGSNNARVDKLCAIRQPSWQ